MSTYATGRINDALPRHLRRRLQGDVITNAHIPELRVQAEIDRATIVMLALQGLCSSEQARGLLVTIDALVASDFHSIIGVDMPRGLYLAVERFLSLQPAGALAADLQRGRSRNDIAATATKIRLRQPLLRVMADILRLVTACIARTDDNSIRSISTNMQPALPVCNGFYFAGVAVELLDDLDRFFAVWPVLQRCPLGASAVAGTPLPIDERLLAEFLGFDSPVENALQAVASRSSVLDALAAAAIIGSTTSRLATDMLDWVSADVGIAKLPDHLIGGSSALPQKRNPFLLEHAQARSSSVIGAFVAASAASMGHPFTNSIAVNTEAVRPVWKALDDLDDCLVFLTACLTALRFDHEAMAKQARGGACIAADLAELARARANDFRTAHHEIGALATQAETQNRPFLEIAAEWATRHGIVASADLLDPERFVRNRNGGGGTGADSMARQRVRLAARWRSSFERWRFLVRHHRAAARRLDAAVARIVG